jgi:hypothetical protein
MPLAFQNFQLLGLRISEIFSLPNLPFHREMELRTLFLRAQRTASSGLDSGRWKAAIKTLVSITTLSMRWFAAEFVHYSLDVLLSFNTKLQSNANLRYAFL